MELSRKIRHIMDEQGLLQEDIARLTGMKQPSISRALAEDSSPKLVTIERIADALGYDLRLVKRNKSKH